MHFSESVHVLFTAKFTSGVQQRQSISLRLNSCKWCAFTESTTAQQMKSAEISLGLTGARRECGRLMKQPRQHSQSSQNVALCAEDG